MSPVYMNPVQGNSSHIQQDPKKTAKAQEQKKEEPSKQEPKKGALARFGGWVGYQLKYTAAFWATAASGSSVQMKAEDVTAGEAASTFILAALVFNPVAWPFMSSGCGPAVDTATGPGGSVDPDDIDFVAGEGMETPRLEVFDDTRNAINFDFTVSVNNLRGVDHIPLRLGTRNVDSATVFNNDLLNCAEGDYSGCRTTSCRVEWSEFQVSPLGVGGQDVTVIDNNNLSYNVERFLSLDPDMTTPRDVLVFPDKTRTGATVYQNAIPGDDWGGLRTLNDPTANFNQYNFADPAQSPQAWMSILNPNICNFGGGTLSSLQDLMRGQSGVIASDWLVLTNDGKTLTDQLPQALPIYVTGVKVTVLNNGKSDYLAVPADAQLTDLDSEGGYAIDLMQSKAVQDWLGDSENGTGYIDVKVEFYCEIDSTQILDTRIPYAFTISSDLSTR